MLFFSLCFLFAYLASLEKISAYSVKTSNAVLYQNQDYRLNTTVWPENYKLELLVVLDELPGFNRFTAPAKAWIKVYCSEQVTQITMHAINLTINESTIEVKDVSGNFNIPIIGVTYTEEFDFIHIQIATSTEPFKLYEIFLEFLIPIYGDRLNGMYQDFYQDPTTGDTKYIATTLFAPYHSRRCFPSFDEPFFRATYDIILGHHNKYNALSNTDIIESRPIENLPDWTWEVFATTPSMSSYIVAMIVGQFDYVEASEDAFRNVSVRVYAKPESILEGAGNYSVKLVGEVMTFFESFFIVPYPITKIYSVALPQFFFNAMENFGLITYKEPVLLYLPGQTTEEERFRINYVVSHEKAHQWFGNIVAVKFWTYVWLKEGFATYYAYHGIQHTNPELVPWVQFIPKILYVAMAFDATNATHPLENYPPTSASVADIYTRIPYEKGASILRMASYMLTDTVFHSGIRQYVNKLQYSNAEQNNVFEELQIAVDNSPIADLMPTTVKSILDTWTTQSGFPLLTVFATTPNTLTITQRKFMDGDTSNPNDRWWVPIFLSIRPNESLPKNFPDAWIPQTSNSVAINIATNQVIIVNPWAAGYYRVLYSKEMIDRILIQLKENHKTIPATARSKIINDYSAFVMTGDSELETLFRLTSYMSRELDLIVWEGLVPFLEKVGKILEDTSAVFKFKRYFGQLANDALKILETTSRPSDIEIGERAILRSLLMKLACSFENVDCLKNTEKLFNEWKLGKPVPLSLQDAVFCTSISMKEQNWAFVYEASVGSSYKFTSFNPLKSRLVRSLGCAKSIPNILKVMHLIKSTSKGVADTPKAEILSQSVQTNKNNAQIILQELAASPELLRIFKGTQEFETFITELTSYSLSEENMKTLKMLVKGTSIERSDAIFEHAVRNVQKNIKIQNKLVSTILEEF